jgi:SAM-dependent methyltransferase
MHLSRSLDKSSMLGNKLSHHVRAFGAVLRSRAKINPAAWCRDYQNWLRYYHDLGRYRKLGSKTERLTYFPCIDDWTAETAVDPTYYYQDAWAFERIVGHRPSEHFDIGSHHKFVALLSKVVPTTMIDIRPLPVTLDSLKFLTGSILSLPFDDESIPSISSICVLEHIGLGRYNDSLDPNGTQLAIAELIRVLKPNGYLYISVPINDQDVTFFNAHRAYTEESVIALFSKLKVTDKAYIYGYKFMRDKQPGYGTICLELQKVAFDQAK